MNLAPNVVRSLTGILPRKLDLPGPTCVTNWPRSDPTAKNQIPCTVLLPTRGIGGTYVILLR